MAFELTVLPGLPAHGGVALTFSETGLGRHSEGFVVAIQSEGSDAWIGNFVRGLTDFDLVTAHPIKRDALVIAGGQAYVVDPGSRELLETYGGAIVGAVRHPKSDALVLNHQGISFECISPSGSLWRSRRVSWDGTRSVRAEGTKIAGEAWHPEDTWHPFSIDLDTGEAVGGSYDAGNHGLSS